MAAKPVSVPIPIPIPISEMALPYGFDTVEYIKGIEILPNGNLKKQFVHVIGFVMDYQPPIKTRGTDSKCSFQIKDYSSRFEKYGLRMSVFASEDKMPRIHNPKDAVLIRNAKAHLRMGEIQLISHKTTEFHILRAANIPKAIFPIINASWISTPPARCRRPEPIETKYVIWANQHLDELALPNTQEFQEKADKAMNVRDKYCLLKDVKEGSFHDIIGEVRKIYGAGFDMVTVYLTDYTAHPQFYNYTLPELSDVATEGRDGDDYGYIKAKSKDEAKDWKGPFGKMTIQLTLWDNHAEFVRDKVKEGQWLRLTNVQFIYGKANLLEGKLRGDRGAFAGKVQVEILKLSEDPQNNDPRWTAGVQRKFDWTKKHKIHRQKFQEEITRTKKKRKADEQTSGKNSKARRKEARANPDAKVSAIETKVTKIFDLNDNVILHPPRHEKAVVPLSTILQRKPLSSDPKYEGIFLPFENKHYKVNVRVVDYYPPNIIDFAVGSKISEFDMLPDYSGDEDVGPEEDMQSYREGKGFVPRKWEWRFALVVEDANPDAPRDRVTLIVGNYDAQTLLNIKDDASNLRENPEMFNNVKETLFKLWGDLEEQKSAMLLQKAQGGKSQNEKVLPEAPSTTDSESDDELDDPRQTNNCLPQDTDEENEKLFRQKKEEKPKKAALAQTGENSKGNEGGEKETSPLAIKPKNKPFECCIKQYGIKLPEEDPEKADAGEGKRWQRVFGLCGTLIK
ncbi:hypothetical protein SBOR_4748 [Sclerotinia borealis F-4128]|uniref:Protection of telomeres protein 1 n=1 Tax=Sclerotinia borealis (strain F-4128) TaxID=1432307 RepID=W9CDQ4_SCLBF|nr:hypothetical protein SBOR_4748 [Sclerotinia borealis F-4128]